MSELQACLKSGIRARACAKGMRAILACVVLLLSGCAAQQALEARRHFPGRAYSELLTCLGPPLHASNLDDGGLIAEWESTDAGANTSIPLAELALLPITLPLSLGGSISMSGAGNCHAIAHVEGGRVVTLRYSGASGGLSGRDAECLPIVRGCLRAFDGEQ